MTSAIEQIAQRVHDMLQAATDDFVGVPFPDFVPYMAVAWPPGAHGAMVGPTGEGKSTLAVPLLKNRKYVMALDPKGRDETLNKSGFLRVTWPLPDEVWEAIERGEPAHLIVGGSTRTDEDLAKLVVDLRAAVKGVRETTGWTLYADEFQILADRRMYALDKEIERMLVAARSDGVSVLTSFQAMAWVPKSSTRQASWAALWPTRDEDMVKAVARAMGRSWRQVWAAVRELPPFHVLIIPKRIHDPMIITAPPKL